MFLCVYVRLRQGKGPNVSHALAVPTCPLHPTQVMSSMQKIQLKRKSDAMQRAERDAVAELEQAAEAMKQKALRWRAVGG